MQEGKAEGERMVKGRWRGYVGRSEKGRWRFAGGIQILGRRERGEDGGG